MLTTTDIAFQESTAIKRNKNSIHKDFVALRDWIQEKYSVAVLNVCYDFIYPSGEKIPRLDIVVEYEKDVEVFKDDNNQIFRDDVVEEITKKFKEVIKSKRKKYKTDNLFLICSAYEPVAKSYVNSQVNKFELDRMIEEVDSPIVWKVQNYFGTTTIFLFTDEQVEKYQDSYFISDLKNDYLEMVKKYDEFGYFDVDSIVINVDSKENFDNNYNSSWFSYYG
jgi:hypothetical protein